MGKIGLINKLLLWLSVFFVIAFGLSWAMLYLTQKPLLLQRSEQEVKSHLKTLSLLLEIHFQQKQENVKVALRAANNLLYEQGAITVTDTLISVVATNQITSEKITLQIPIWYYQGKPLHYDYQLVDKIEAIAKSTITIFQKIPQGYLRIATTVRNKKGERAINTFIPENSPVAQNIDKGIRYTGRAFVIDDWYVTQYEPIFSEGKVIGMLYAGVKEDNIENLRKAIYSHTYFGTGTAWCLNENGVFLAHNTQEGIKISENKLWEYIQEYKTGKFRLYDAENQEFKWIYFQYNPTYKMYLGIEISEATLVDESLNALTERMFLVFIVILVVIALLTYWLLRNTIQPLKVVRNHLEKLAQGIIPSPIQKHRKDEIGEMTRSCNTLIEGFQAYTHFAEQIAEGNLATHFTPLSQKDALGSSLKIMQENLQQAQIVQQQAQWRSQALNRFDRLLRKYNHDETQLVQEFLRKFVQYFKAQVGIIYLKPLHTSQEFLLAAAHFAKDTQYEQQEKISTSEGLVGQVYQHKQKQILEKIPENYWAVQTGLGKITPKTLCLFPIFTEEENFGVIEIGSLFMLDNFQQKTIEEIIDNFAFSLYKIRLMQTQ